MLTRSQIEVSHEKIAEFCQKWRIIEFCLFGSVLREDFRPESDVDVLVTFAPQCEPSFLQMLQMESELRQLFGRQIDLVDRRLVEQSDNYIRRRHILDTAQVIYAA